MVKVKLGFFLDMKVGSEEMGYSCEKVVSLSREPVIGENVQVSVTMTDGGLRHYSVEILSASTLIENYEFSRYRVVPSQALKDYLLDHLMGDTSWQINQA